MAFQPYLWPAKLPRIESYVPSTWELAQREKYLAESARAAGIEDPPRVEIVAWQNPDAVGDTLVRCLQEAGVPAERTADGYEYESSGDQREYAAANYKCTAKYPVRSDIDRPVSDAEATMLHRHLVSEFIPCVERNLGQSLTRPEFDV